MRRIPSLALVGALLCLLAGVGPALAADHHRHTAHHTATSAQGTATAKPLASSKSATRMVGRPTTKDGLAVLNDCQSHGQLTRNYPLSWLRKAQSMMSPGTAQYSNCSTVLQQAILHDTRPGSGGGGGSGATTIVIIVAIVLVILAALLGALALRRRRGSGPASA
ncbi:MAG TPA: hypothetical protein VKV21_07920 [Solirubrobacteraceae bacterium]|nr:hypothetical protein [Solirubrobacteraceae bacterium]